MAFLSSSLLHSYHCTFLSTTSWKKFSVTPLCCTSRSFSTNPIEFNFQTKAQPNSGLVFASHYENQSVQCRKKIVCFSENDISVQKSFYSNSLKTLTSNFENDVNSKFCVTPESLLRTPQFPSWIHRMHFPFLDTFLLSFPAFLIVLLLGCNSAMAAEIPSTFSQIHSFSTSTIFESKSITNSNNNLLTFELAAPLSSASINTSNASSTMNLTMLFDPKLEIFPSFDSILQSILQWLPFSLLSSISPVEEIEPSKGNCATCIGNVDDTLASCGLIPNCVSSFDDRPAFFIAPWEYEGSLQEAMDALKKTISFSDGILKEEGERYIYATFIKDDQMDDVEFIFGKFESDRTVNIHSSSRSINRLDGGRNRKRVEGMRMQLGWNEVPILQNRNRLFVVIESPWDTFGPEPPPTYDLNDLDLE